MESLPSMRPLTTRGSSTRTLSPWGKLDGPETWQSTSRHTVSRQRARVVDMARSYGVPETSPEVHPHTTLSLVTVHVPPHDRWLASSHLKIKLTCHFSAAGQMTQIVRRHTAGGRDPVHAGVTGGKTCRWPKRTAHTSTSRNRLEAEHEARSQP